MKYSIVIIITLFSLWLLNVEKSIGQERKQNSPAEFNRFPENDFKVFDVKKTKLRRGRKVKVFWKGGKINDKLNF